MNAAALPAPAKINFGLRLLARRDDGYHEIDSLLLPLDLEDEVRVARCSGAEIELILEGEVAGVPDDGSNLAVRAAGAFLEEAGVKTGLEVRLHKRTPAAAGLGGGSSDAGAVLRALSALWPEAVTGAALRALALGLGADVPYFLDPRPARVGGIGERIEPVADLPPLSLLLANPGTPLATAEVYRAADALAPALTPSDPGPTMRPLLELGGRRCDASAARALQALAANDLEPAATRLCPPIARLRDRLRDLGALAVGLSGSGPTLFGVFEDGGAASAARARAHIRPPAWCRVAETRRSP